jgi:hypothetical protein
LPYRRLIHLSITLNPHVPTIAVKEVPFDEVAGYCNAPFENRGVFDGGYRPNIACREPR